MATLKQKHDAYIQRVKAGGGKTLKYTAPCCGASLEDPAAPRGETWDTVATCPDCGGLFVKITKATGIRAETLPETA